MIAALLAAAVSPASAAMLVVIVRAGAFRPAPPQRDDPAARAVAAELADYSWRERELAPIRVHGHFEIVRQMELHADEFRAVYGPRPTARQTPGIDRLATWWTPIGRPPIAPPARSWCPDCRHSLQFGLAHYCTRTSTYVEGVAA